ncbi:MAG: SET domain-containing protein-lysine N-methyltransferase [Patescibacteria group bacterium]
MSDVYLGHSAINGQGVFAGRDFSVGERVLEYKGPLVHGSDIPKDDFYGLGDRYVQIGQDLFLGASDEIDDYLNHSCNPNAGIVVEGNTVNVVAIRPIPAGEEIVWDYSTTLDMKGEWEVRCTCGSSNCRGFVRDFLSLPPETQQRYKDLGVVPQYLF